MYRGVVITAPILDPPDTEQSVTARLLNDRVPEPDRQEGAIIGHVRLARIDRI